jgi:hypothetical protein
MLSRLGELDATRTAAVRLEQSILRSHLFGGKETGICALCGESFPISLLVAAHIKRRADSDDMEKRDRDIVMPVCTFGCDELFERGYIVVINGRVADGPLIPQTDVVKRRVSFLRGKICSHWNERTAKYFASRRSEPA